jgi:hypothetical protein
VLQSYLLPPCAHTMLVAPSTCPHHDLHSRLCASCVPKQILHNYEQTLLLLILSTHSNAVYREPEERVDVKAFLSKLHVFTVAELYLMICWCGVCLRDHMNCMNADSWSMSCLQLCPNFLHVGIKKMKISCLN